MGGTGADIPGPDTKYSKPTMITQSEPRATHQKMMTAKVFMVASVRHTSNSSDLYIE